MVSSFDETARRVARLVTMRKQLGDTHTEAVDHVAAALGVSRNAVETALAVVVGLVVRGA